MSSVVTLLDDQIPRRIRNLAPSTESLDVMSYGTVGGDRALQLLALFPRSRLILGHFFEDDYQRAYVFARAIPACLKCETRLLANSHAKMLLFMGEHPRALVGSYNLGSPAQHESAVIVDGYPAMNFRRAFENYWKRSIKVNRLNLGDVKRNLVGGSFEVPR